MEGILDRLKDTFDPYYMESFFGPLSLYGGFFVGTLLGIILQKGRLCKYDIVSGMFRLQDFTFFRVGTPLLMVGMILIYFFKDLGAIELYIPDTVPLAQLIGGVIFGSGLAIAGYCPAIAAGALGEGNLDAIPAGVGIIIGSVLYAEFYHETTLDMVIGYINLGRVTFQDIFLIFNHWFFIIPFVFMCLMFLIGISMYDEFLRFSFFTVGKIFCIFKSLDNKKCEKGKRVRR